MRHWRAEGTCPDLAGQRCWNNRLESDISLFPTRKSLESAKRRSYQAGVLEGKDLAKVFAWMRPNDLIWNYWVNNYLLGNEPPVYDILHWNNDTTRLPAALHGEFIDMFKNNPLTRAGALEVCGTPVDLKQVTCDLFCVAGNHRPHYPLGVVLQVGQPVRRQV